MTIVEILVVSFFIIGLILAIPNAWLAYKRYRKEQEKQLKEWWKHLPK